MIQSPLVRVAGAALLFLALIGCAGEPEIQQPVPLYGEDPIQYPVDLWDQDMEGIALLRLRVTDRGDVDSVEVTESSGFDALDAAAVEGARALRFEPGRKDGTRVRMWASLPVEFSKRPRTNDDP